MTKQFLIIEPLLCFRCSDEHILCSHSLKNDALKKNYFWLGDIAREKGHRSLILTRKNLEN